MGKNKVNIPQNFKDPDFVFSPQITLFEPFAGCVDPSRSNMSSKQITQGIIGENVEIPFMFNKNYADFTQIPSKYVEFAEDDGLILYNKNKIMVFYNLSNGKLKYYKIDDYISWDAFSIKIKTITNKKKVLKGDILFDYTHQTNEHLPRIGYRTKVLYSSFFGYNAEDAMVISESFAKKATIDYHTKIMIPITKELKYFRNEKNNYFYKKGEITQSEFLKFIKIDTTKHTLSEFNNISNKESKFFSKVIDSIEGGKVVNIKVHKINKNKADVIKNQYIFNDGLIDEVETLFLETKTMYFDLQDSLSNIPGLNQEMIKKSLDNFFVRNITSPLNKAILGEISEKFNIDQNIIDYVLEIDVGFKLGTDRGDKFANMYAGKGVISLIIPDELMPVAEDGTIPDMVFNPLGVFGRNNWGTVYEETNSSIILDVEKIAKYVYQKIENNYILGDFFTEANSLIDRIDFINTHFINKIDKEYSARIDTLKSDLYYSIYDTNDEILFENQFKGKESFLYLFVKDIVENRFYMFVDNFPNMTYNEFIDDYILLYEKEFNINCTEKQPITFKKELLTWLRNKNFSSNIFNKKMDASHEDLVIPLKLSNNYFMKLQHTSYSKFNSVGLASSYNASTGQPAKGKQKVGGVGYSWMSTAAFYGHVKNNNILKEFYTIKSDATYKEKIRFTSILMRGNEYVLKNKYISNTKNAVNNFLKLMGLTFDDIKEQKYKIFDNEDEINNMNDLFDDIDLHTDNLDISSKIDNTEDDIEDDTLNFDKKFLDENEFKNSNIKIREFNPDNFKIEEQKSKKTIEDYFKDTEFNIEDLNIDLLDQIELGDIIEYEKVQMLNDEDLDDEITEYDLEDINNLDTLANDSINKKTHNNHEFNPKDFKKKLTDNISDFGNNIGFEIDTYYEDIDNDDDEE